MHRRLPAAAIAVAVAFGAGLLHPAIARADLAAGVMDSAAVTPPQTTPDQGLPDALDGFQDADPAAAIDLIEPPEVDGFGSVQLRHPITIPKGRSSWQPQLSLAYGSDSDNGWLGIGWDVSLDAIRVPGLGSDVSADAIEVDTRWGVPRYDPAYESETYVFGDEQLSPTAHTPEKIPRIDDRLYKKRVEGDFLRIIRHGNSPEDYWFEVHDKIGNKYFYGGALHQACSDPRPATGAEPKTPCREDDDATNASSSVVEEAVLRDGEGNIYFWGLREKWDISTNVVTYFYEKLTGAQGDTGVGDGNQPGAPRGTQHYLSRINYSGSKLGIIHNEWDPAVVDGLEGDRLPRFGPYNVTFVRDSQLPNYQRRPDVETDAAHGALDVEAELLKRIDITYKNDLVRSYHLNYQRGPFDKTLLKSVDQADADDHVFSTHDFDYYDEIRNPDGSYKGFAAQEQWRTNGDDVGQEFFGGLFESDSAIGKTTAKGGDGRLFLGFGLLPEKTVAAGGGLQFAGGNSRTDLEMLDINGDNLPDKVFRAHFDDTPGARPKVYYRLNTSGANAAPGQVTYSAQPREAQFLPGLTEDSEFSTGVSAEAYLFATLMYAHTWSWAKTTSYFSDVNADGLPDYVSGGKVLFNHRLPDGSIVFTATSDGTDVEIQGAPVEVDQNVVPSFDDLEARQAPEFPRQDTVRRWLAPTGGFIDLDAPVRLLEILNEEGQPASDGVQVTIQHNASTIWATTISPGDTTLKTPNLAPFGVFPGDRIYFRVQPLAAGAGDVVEWDPTIHYVGHDPQLDVNGLDLWRYSGSGDFTTAGARDMFVGMPYDGRVRLRGTLNKAHAVSDDVRVEIVRIRGAGPDAVSAQVCCDDVIAWDETGDFPIDVEINVKGPDFDEAGAATTAGDRLYVRLGVDTNIDVNAITWTPELFYLQAADSGGNPIATTGPDGNPIIRMSVPYDLPIYPNTNIFAQEPAFGDEGENSEVAVTITATDIADLDLPAPVTFSVKRRNQLVFKHTMTIPERGGGIGGWQQCGLGEPCTDKFVIDDHFPWFPGDADVWFDFTFDSQDVADHTSVFVSEGQAAKWWPGVRIIDEKAEVFPPPYRGWGYAGYNGSEERADLPMNEANFLLEQGDFPDPEDLPEEPDDPSEISGSHDIFGGDNPVRGNSYIYVPVPERDLWQGPKDAGTSGLIGSTYGTANRMAASLLGPDDLGPPGERIVGLGAHAPSIQGRSEADSVGASAGSLIPGSPGGGAAWGRSSGIVDYIDMNGDGYPDVVGEEFQFTNPVGRLDNSSIDVPGLGGDIRFDHSFGNDVSGGGTPVALGGSSSGDNNTSKSAGSGGGGGGGSGGGGDGSGGGGAKKSKRAKAAKAVGSGAKKAMKVGVSMGLSGGIGYSQTNSQDTGKQLELQADDGVTGNTEEDFADLNGDGLPDRVRVDIHGDLFVKWNLGYSFTDEAEWPHGQSLEEGSSANKSLGITLGFNAGKFDFTGGASLTLDTTGTDVTWTDVNGDGLDDRVSTLRDWDDPLEILERETDGVVVEFNTGSGLMGAVDYGHFQHDNISSSETTSLGGGADFTVGIGPLCVYVCFIIINPGGHGEESHSATSVDLTDMDGDGFADSVSSDDDEFLYVSRNQVGRTNLLKTVHRPLGARFDVEYDREGNTTAYPETTWVMSKVTLHDGHGGDGADVQMTTFEYFDARYDWGEREDYGFARVIERQHNTLDDNRVYRSWESVYANTNYYERGQLQAETLFNADGHALTSTANTFALVDSASGLLGDTTSLTGSIYPKLTVEENRVHDPANGAIMKRTELRFEFDRRGNMTRVEDIGEPALPGDDLVATMRITKCDDLDPESPGYEPEGIEFPWTQMADAMVVRSGSTVVQRRVADIDCNTASVSEIHDFLDPNAPADITNEITLESDDARCPVDSPLPPSVPDPPGVAISIVCYLVVGGQTSAVENPSNAQGQKYRADYEWDVIGNNIVRTVDSYGLATASTFDQRFAKVATTIDAVGGKTSYSYDKRGRLDWTIGPLEQGRLDAQNNQIKTIDFTYHPDNDVPWAVASHFDPANPTDRIDTVSLVDGLVREIQYKQDSTIFRSATQTPLDQVTVSGRTWFDAFGRAVREAYPTTEPLGTPGTFRVTPAAEVSESTFDALDRVTSLVQPGGRTTTSTYGFAAGPFTTTMATEFRTDPEGARTRLYMDVRSNVVGVERLHRLANGSDQVLFTRNEYDALQRLVKVTEANQHVTTSGYDLLGRRTFVNNPDTGKTEFRYDAASNVIAEITPVLRAQSKQISMTYDFERLKGVQYPNNPANNVTYDYGAPGVRAANDAGLVSRVNDGARTTTIKYDRLGQVVDETEFVKFSVQPRSYTTKYAVDTWGRDLTVTYPDGEVLTYGYDSGGLADGVSGRKGTTTYPYASRLEYDKFGNRRYLTYGNGTATEINYDPLTIWPTRQRVSRGSTLLSDLNYAYDKVGNVLARNDLRQTTPPLYTDPGGPSQQSFLYDDLYRLVSATGTYTPRANVIRSYTYQVTYDDKGRVTRRTQTDRLAGQLQPATSFDMALTYGTAQPHAPSRIGPRAYTWDANGNVSKHVTDVTNATRTFGWDEEDRLLSVQQPAGLAMTYRYDAEDDLTIRRDTGGLEIGFVNDLYTSVTSSRHWKDIYLDDVQVATREVAGFIEQQPMYMTTDILDSTYLVTNSAGSAYESTQYLPTGEIWDRVQTATARERRLFAGSYFDESTKLNNMEARWYEPRDGLMYGAEPMITEDLDAVVGEPRLLGSFNYAFDIPTTYVDETGEKATKPPKQKEIEAILLGAAIRDIAREGPVPDDFRKAERKLAGGSSGHQFGKYIARAFSVPDDDNAQDLNDALGWADPVAMLTEINIEFDGSWNVKKVKIGKIDVGATGKFFKRQIKKLKH